MEKCDFPFDDYFTFVQNPFILPRSWETWWNHFYIVTDLAVRALPKQLKVVSKKGSFFDFCLTYVLEIGVYFFKCVFCVCQATFSLQLGGIITSHPLVSQVQFNWSLFCEISISVQIWTSIWIDPLHLLAISSSHSEHTSFKVQKTLA